MQITKVKQGTKYTFYINTQQEEEQEEKEKEEEKDKTQTHRVRVRVRVRVRIRMKIQYNTLHYVTYATSRCVPSLDCCLEWACLIFTTIYFSKEK